MSAEVVYNISTQLVEMEWVMRIGESVSISPNPPFPYVKHSLILTLVDGTVVEAEVTKVTKEHE